MLWIVLYDDGRQYVNYEPLSQAEHRQLRKRGESYREIRYEKWSIHDHRQADRR